MTRARLESFLIFFLLFEFFCNLSGLQMSCQNVDFHKDISSEDQDQDQDRLLVKRRNDNHSPGPVIREH